MTVPLVNLQSCTRVSLVGFECFMRALLRIRPSCMIVSLVVRQGCIIISVVKFGSVIRAPFVDIESCIRLHLVL